MCSSPLLETQKSFLNLSYTVQSYSNTEEQERPKAIHVAEVLTNAELIELVKRTLCPSSTTSVWLDF